MHKPRIIITVKVLPFAALSPQEFERMCLWLVEREGFLRPQHLGETGSDQGRDIAAYKLNGRCEELWYFQCKRYQKISSAILKGEVDKINGLAASDPTKKPTWIVFVTNATVSARVREEVSIYCREGGYGCDFWAHTELDMYVKKHPAIVAEFFGAAQVHDVPALHQLPPPPSDFTGRANELERLIYAVEERATLGLYGMGGVGKSALALKLAERLIPRYPDAQIYVDLKGTSQEPLSVADAMLHVIRAYQPTSDPPRSEAEMTGRYRSVLYEQRAILFLDNAASREQIEPLTPPPGSLLLVTSRHHFHLPGLISVHVESLPREDSQSLLLAIAPRIEGKADAISQLCGDLPLALRLAGSVLAERADLGTVDYVQRLSDTRRRLALVEASIRLSYELLTTLGQELWRRLAILPGDFEAEGAAYMMGLGLEAELARDVLSEFVRLSMLEWDSAKGRYHMHELVRFFAEEHLSEAKRQDCRLRYVNYYGAILVEANSLYVMGGAAAERALSTMDAEWDNFRAAQMWTEENTPTDDEAAAMCNAFPNAGAYLLDLRQLPGERIRWLEAALGASKKLGIRDSEGAHLANLGIAHTSMGNPRRAIELLEQSLAIHRELGDRKGEGSVLGSLGNAYAALGDNRHAIEFYEQDLAIMREFGERRGEGIILNNLGNAYAALGEVSRAISHYEDALMILRETGDRHSEGGALGSLGLLYADLGDIPRAIWLYEQALQISRDMGDLRGEGHNLGNLGVALFNAGAYEEGLDCHQRQFDIARDTHGEACALGGLASIYTAMNEKRLAAECFEKALKMFREIGDRFMEGKTLGNWGNLFIKVRDAHRATGFYEQQLTIAREIGDRRSEAAALWNIGWAFSLMGDATQAIGYGEAALRIYEDLGDVNQTFKSRKYLDEWRKQM